MLAVLAGNSVGWVEFPATVIYALFSEMDDKAKPCTSKQDCEKMVGVLKGIVSKRDNDAIMKDSLC